MADSYGNGVRIKTLDTEGHEVDISGAPAAQTKKVEHRKLLADVDALVAGSSMGPEDQLAVLTLACVMAVRRVLAKNGFNDRVRRRLLLRAVESDWVKVLRQYAAEG